MGIVAAGYAICAVLAWPLHRSMLHRRRLPPGVRAAYRRRRRAPTSVAQVALTHRVVAGLPDRHLHPLPPMEARHPLNPEVSLGTYFKCRSALISSRRGDQAEGDSSPTRLGLDQDDRP